jgi:4-amino-4-deoxy-L-arabinose transferase-like glycosyltransferase
MRLTLIWACLLVRLAFYAAMLPLWEGADEWGHFAVAQSAALRGELLASRGRPIPRNIEASLALAPLPWELRKLDPPAVTHDVYWQLPPVERERRAAALRDIPSEWALEDGSGAFSNYEAQQPPLYYWLAAPLIWLMRGRSLAAQVLAVRFLSALAASLVVPLVYRIGRELFEDASMALGCAAIVALMPGFSGVAARVGNDGLAATFYAALILAGLTLWRKPGLRVACATALMLGLGLLTKAYFLTAIPPVLWLLWRRGYLRAAVVPAVLAGWWYVRSAATAGSPLTTGLQSGLTISLAAVLRGVPSVPWLKAVDAALFSHIYCGGWSWLTVRSWIYHAFYLVLAVAAIGLWRWRRNPGILWLVAIYVFFWAGELWHAALLFAARGVPASMGFYLYSVVAAEVPLCVAGLATWLRRWAAPLGAAMFALLDLATMHLLALPYYSGTTRHQAGGVVHFAHFNQLTFPHGPLLVLWLCYLLATVSAAASAMPISSPPIASHKRQPSGR